MRFNQPSVNEMLNRFFNDYDYHTREKSCHHPAVNIRETEELFEMCFLVPGMKKEDFNINLEEDLLTVSAELASEKEEQKGGYAHKEFTLASFERRFTMPNTVDPEKIAASYENGILVVTLPKREEAKPQPARMIPIA